MAENMHNVRRRQEVQRVMENRVITEYVQFKHPRIYEKAKAFYTELKALYPQKKDVRRTYEFQTFITGVESKKYKYSNRLHRQHMEITDNMVLNIQLMDNFPVPAVVPPAVPAVVPPAVPAVVPPAVPAVVPPAVPAVPTTVSPMDTIIEDTEITLPVVSDDIIDEIIEGLRQDPDINSIFDDIDIEDPTPLERELSLW